MNSAFAAFQLEGWEEAEQALARAIEINPQRAASFLNLSKLERCTEAIPVLERALELQADLYTAHFYLYGCHLLLGDKKKSEKALERYNEGR